MLNCINGIFFTPQIINTKYENRQKYPNLAPLPKDTLSFTGMSKPSEYHSVFQYLAANILKQNPNKFDVNGHMLSSTNILDGIKELFSENRIYTEYIKSDPQKIKWKNYIPDDVRIPETARVNDARISRLNEWKTFLENPIAHEEAECYNELVKDMNSDPSVKFVIWDAVNSELKEDNRHIPVPLNLQALSETIRGFRNIEPKDRAVRCTSPSFVDIYTHRLRDNLLMDMGLSDNDSVWVKIPSLEHDKINHQRNIRTVETLSNKNWCTRSEVDKAEAALQDGDFYVYLARNPRNLWQPLIGMAASRGKIDQIQGPLNNNIIPLNQLEIVKQFIAKNNLECRKAIVDEGPKAYQQILISEKLAEKRPNFDKSFEQAIKANKVDLIYQYLDKPVTKLEDGTLEIGTYKPSYVPNKKTGISIPYSMMGVDEQELLKNVKIIDGNMLLADNDSRFSSSIKEFPSSLQKVTGKIICNETQYKNFEVDLKRVTNNIPGKIIIYPNP